MDFMTIAGLLAGAGTIYYVMADGAILHLLFNPIALVLVFGGTFSATLIAYPWDIIRQVVPALKLMFVAKKRTEDDRLDLIVTMANLAEKAKTQSLESLQGSIKDHPDEFLRYGIQMVVDGIEENVIRDNLENKVLVSHQNTQKVNGVFRTMGTFSPIFGLLGTLIGVVQVLRNLSDPSSMGASMAIAITTTFYGIFAANFLFLPSSIKLGELNENETFRKNIMTEGIMSISRGELPSIVRKKLNAYLLSYLREQGSRPSQTL
jgi:chemotaxis protein MotA